VKIIDVTWQVVLPDEATNEDIEALVQLVDRIAFTRNVTGPGIFNPKVYTTAKPTWKVIDG
jgi:hypothetical protein